MTDGRKSASCPVRIELATSEIEGGNCRTWADPAQVLAVVARSQPEDTFVRFVEGKLHDLAAGGGAGDDAAGTRTEGSGGEALPPAVQTLISRLQAVHSRLYRENRSLMRDPSSVEVYCALAEEDRIYFVRTAPCWVGLLRGGRAYSAGGGGEEPAKLSTPIGKAESLNLEVTSLSVLPGDTVVILAAETETPPDLHAVRNLFTQTPDLKRACDGLVNLQGLISPSAGAVAMRFLQVESRAEATTRENPLSGLGIELGGVPDAAIGSTQPTGLAPQEPPPSPQFDREVEAALAGFDSVASGPESKFQPDADISGPGRSEPAPQPGTGAPLPLAGSPERVQSSPDPSGSLGRGFGPEPFDPEPLVRELENEVVPAFARSRRRAVLWAAMAGLVGVILLALVALPGRDGESVLRRAWSGSAGKGPGSVEVAPEPAAERILIDGRFVGGATPTRVEAVSPGRHTLGLDMGPAGTWTTEIEVPAAGTVRVAPFLTGSVEVSASDPSANARVWVEGREKMTLPATLDSLPIGWNRLFFEDAHVPMWDRRVLVHVGAPERVVVPNTRSASGGIVRVEGMRYAEKMGMVVAEGDSVWFDGRSVGRTPLESSLAPGLHSVRVGTAGDSYTEVIEVRGGGARHVVAQLGRGQTPVFKHVSPGRVDVRGSLLLSVEVQGIAPGPNSRPTLHIPSLTPGSREVPLSPVDPEAGVYVAAVDPAALPDETPVSYYFTVNGPTDEVFWSDVYTLTARSSGSGEAGTPGDGAESADPASEDVGGVASAVPVSAGSAAGIPSADVDPSMEDAPPASGLQSESESTQAGGTPSVASPPDHLGASIDGDRR